MRINKRIIRESKSMFILHDSPFVKTSNYEIKKIKINTFE